MRQKAAEAVGSLSISGGASSPSGRQLLETRCRLVQLMRARTGGIPGTLTSIPGGP